jgi:uncharacterized membrane protein
MCLVAGVSGAALCRRSFLIGAQPGQLSTTTCNSPVPKSPTHGHAARRQRSVTHGRHDATWWWFSWVSAGPSLVPTFHGSRWRWLSGLPQHLGERSPAARKVVEMGRMTVGVVALAALSSVVVGNASEEVRDTVTDLGTLSGLNHGSCANGLNNNGQVVVSCLSRNRSFPALELA